MPNDPLDTAPVRVDAPLTIASATSGLTRRYDAPKPSLGHRRLRRQYGSSGSRSSHVGSNPCTVAAARVDRRGGLDLKVSRVNAGSRIAALI